MNTLAGLVSLAAWWFIGSHALLFFTAVNFLLGIGILLPFPGIDGEVIWRELRRS